MKRMLSILLFLSGTFLSAQAFALPGLDNVLWHTTFQTVGGGSADADLTIDNWQSGSTYPTGAGDADGSLAITRYQLRQDTGLTSTFSGTWSRGGDSGTFTFTVFYQNGQPVHLAGYYSGASTNGMMLPWTGNP